MIVVVIIGILAAVAIPSYQGFQNKAKGAEAKVALSAIYSAEKAYYAEETKYSNLLATIGIQVETYKYYLAIGFKNASGVMVTSATGTTVTGANDQVHENCTASDTAFTACAQRVAKGAAGTNNVPPATDYNNNTDWNIDQAKNLTQDTP